MRTNDAASSFHAFFVIETFVVTTARNSANGGLAYAGDATLIVSFTEHADSGTRYVRISAGSGWTSALLLMFLDATEAIGSASSRRSAWVDTLVINASVFQRTLDVRPTTDNASVLVANFSGWAIPVSLALNVTPGVETTFIDGAASIFLAKKSAKAVGTHVSGSALVAIDAAFLFSDATDVSVGSAVEANWTTANGSVVDHLAFGVRTASGASLTGIDAIVGDASQMIRALSTGPAAYLTAVADTDFLVLAVVILATLNDAMVTVALFSNRAIMVLYAFDSTFAFEAQIVGWAIGL